MANAWSPTFPRPNADSLCTEADIGNFFVSLLFEFPEESGRL